MNVLQVLAITTIVYFGFVTFWVTKMEDFLHAPNDEQIDGAGDSSAAEPEIDNSRKGDR